MSSATLTASAVNNAARRGSAPGPPSAGDQRLVGVSAVSRPAVVRGGDRGPQAGRRPTRTFTHPKWLLWVMKLKS